MVVSVRMNDQLTTNTLHVKNVYNYVVVAIKAIII